MPLEETPAVLSLEKLCDGHGYTYHWTSVQKTTSHPKLQEHQLQFCDFCTIRCPWVCRRVPLLHHHLLLQHLHRRRLWSARKIQQQKEVRLFMCEESRGSPLHGSVANENTKTWGRRRFTKWIIAWSAGLATGIQREFGCSKCSCWVTGKPIAWTSRHFGFFSSITTGAASKSGIGPR